MIVTVHLLCGRECRTFYIMIIQLHSRLGLGHAPPGKFCKNSVIWCVFVYIWIRFCLK